MTDFFDWLTAADSGLAADRLARQFRLSQKELRETADALIPAYLLAMRRMAADPGAWTALLGSVPFAVGGNPGLDAVSDGEAASLVERLLGTGPLAQAIARQASMATGLAPDAVARMMPGLAVLTMQAVGRMAGASRPGGYPTDDAGRVVAEMMRRSANAVDAFSRPANAPSKAKGGAMPGSDYLSSLFADALKGAFPWTAAAKDGQKASEPSRPGASAAQPFPHFGAMLDAYAQSLHRPSSDAPRQPENLSRKPGNDDAGQGGSTPSADPFAAWMETGRSAQTGYMREMMALFERYGPKAG